MTKWWIHWDVQNSVVWTFCNAPNTVWVELSENPGSDTLGMEQAQMAEALE